MQKNLNKISLNFHSKASKIWKNFAVIWNFFLLEIKKNHSFKMKNFKKFLVHEYAMCTAFYHGIWYRHTIFINLWNWICVKSHLIPPKAFPMNFLYSLFCTLFFSVCMCALWLVVIYGESEQHESFACKATFFGKGFHNINSKNVLQHYSCIFFLH